MKVCMVTQAIYPDVIGGAPIAIHELASALVDAGAAVEVHTVDYGTGGAQPTSYRLVRHRRLRGPWDWVGTQGNPVVPGLGKAVATSGASIVHIHSHLFFPSLAAARAARKAGIPYVVTVHGLRAVRGPLVNALQTVWLQTVARRIFAHASRVLCLNERDAADVCRYGADASKVLLTGNIVRTDIFHPGAERSKKVVWTGRHVAEKDVVTLLRAWGRVQHRFPGYELWLIGDGPLRAMHESLAKKLALRARFLDPVRQVELAAIVRDAHLFVFPSVREGLPLSLLEAMASGVPVIASESMVSIARHGGTTFPIGDDEALASSIEYMLTTLAARSLGFDGAAWVRSKFEAKRIAEETLGIYRSAGALV